MQEAQASEQQLRQQVEELQVAVQSSTGGVERQGVDLQKQLESAKMEVEMSRQNADIMREALQVSLQA